MRSHTYLISVQFSAVPSVHTQYSLNQNPILTLIRETSPLILITQSAEGGGHPECPHLSQGLFARSLSTSHPQPHDAGMLLLFLSHTGDGESNGQPRAGQQKTRMQLKISCSTYSSPSPARHLFLCCFTAIFSLKQVTTPPESLGVLVGFIFLLQNHTVSSSFFGTFEFGPGRKPATHLVLYLFLMGNSQN